MVLSVVDDLLFASKIKSAVSHAGTTVLFARSREAALEAMRRERPALVIFDLDNPRTAPLEVLVAMKADGDLRDVPTIGFVSHVRADIIDAARHAGVDEVVARSAFAARLADVLASQTGAGSH
jgi:CheY-like chemotaxis protein